MAGVQPMQCPKCGSPLEVTPSTTQARCSYCGSMLRVSRDASGQPLAVLDDIREDTDILATDVVRKRLEERLAARHSLGCEYAAAREKARASAGCVTWGFVAVGGLIGAFVSGGLGKNVAAEAVGCFSLGGAVVGTLIGGWLLDLQRKAARTKVEEEYGPPMRALEADVPEEQRQIGAATARMDGLITDARGP